MRWYFGGSGLINSTINRLPFEAHLPGYRFCGPGTKLEERIEQDGINPLDEACKEHDIAYNRHKDLASRQAADRVLTDKAWDRYRSKDTPLGEKVAAWIVTTGIKAKSKLGGTMLFDTLPVRRRMRRGNKRRHRRSVSGGALTFAKLVKHARSAVRGSGAASSIHQSAMAALKAARQLKKGKRIAYKERTLALPARGGILPLLPIFAGLSAIGSLAGGAAGIAKAVTQTNDAKRRLAELQRHNQTMEAIALGKGLYLKPYKKGLGLHMTPYVKQTKNC